MSIYNISFVKPKSVNICSYQVSETANYTDRNMSITIMDQLTNMESNNYHKYLEIEMIDDALLLQWLK